MFRLKKILILVLTTIVALNFQSCRSKKALAEISYLYKSCDESASEKQLYISRLNEQNSFLKSKNLRLQEQLLKVENTESHYVGVAPKYPVLEVAPVTYGTVEDVSGLPVAYFSTNDYHESQERQDEIKQDSLQDIIDNFKTSNYGISYGKIAFYCPKTLTHKKIYNAYGLIADVISDNKVREMLIDNVKEINGGLSEDSLNNDDFLIKEIKYYNIIELSFDEVLNQDFDIEKVHEQDKQFVSSKMEGWHWQIRPMSSKENQQLILKVKIFKPNGELDDVFSRKYNFKIIVDPFSFVSDVKELFLKEPKWALGSIILPFITFLYGRYDKRKKTTSNA